MRLPDYGPDVDGRVDSIPRFFDLATLEDVALWRLVCDVSGDRFEWRAIRLQGRCYPSVVFLHQCGSHVEANAGICHYWLWDDRPLSRPGFGRSPQFTADGS